MKYYLQVMEIHTSKDGFNSGRTYFFRSQVCKILRYRYISVNIGIGTHRCILTPFFSRRARTEPWALHPKKFASLLSCIRANISHLHTLIGLHLRSEGLSSHIRATIILYKDLLYTLLSHITANIIPMGIYRPRTQSWALRPKSCDIARPVPAYTRSLVSPSMRDFKKRYDIGKYS